MNKILINNKIKKNKNRNRNNKKAVSTIITVVILIAIITILIAMFASWSVDNTKKQLDFMNENVEIKSKLECNNLKLEFRDLKIDRVTKHISFLVTNNSSTSVDNLIISLQAKTYNKNEVKIVGVYKADIDAGSVLNISTDSNNFQFLKQDFLLIDVDPTTIDLLTITSPSCAENNYDLSDIDVYDSLNDYVIANWSFAQNDSDGNIIYDLSGNEYNGVSYNQPIFVANHKGEVNSAMFFNGTNDSINFGRPEKIEMLEESRTLSFWLLAFPGNEDTGQIFFAQASGGHKGYGANIRFDSDRFRSEVYGSIGGRQVSYKTGLSIFDQLWKHYTVVYDTNGFLIKTYINSNLIYTSDFEDWGVVNYNDGQDVVIGQYASYVGMWPLFASLSDFKIYNKALSQEEINIIYNENKNLVYNNLPVIDGLKGYWTLDQSDSNSTTIYDLSGQNNNAISNNDPVFVEDQKGNANGAISFNGVDDYLTLDSLSFERSQDWSFSMWQYKPDGSSDRWQAFIGYNLGSYGGYWMWHPKIKWYQDYYDDGSGYSYYGCFYSSSSNTILGDNIPFDTWFNISITYNGSNETINVYINGVLTDTSVVDWSPRPVEKFYFKYLGTAASRFFSGYISDFIMYDRVLDQSEIQDLYEFGLEN